MLLSEPRTLCRLLFPARTAFGASFLGGTEGRGTPQPAAGVGSSLFIYNSTLVSPCSLLAIYFFKSLL